MSKFNATAQVEKQYTHEGAPAYLHLTPLQELRRTVLSTFLGNAFYESEQPLMARIKDLSQKVSAQDLYDVINEARNVHGLRSVSILLTVFMVNYHKGEFVSKAIDAAIQRADELTEIMSAYHDVNGKVKIKCVLRKGVRRAFAKFSPYHLARNQAKDKVWKLKDVINVVRPTPINDELSACYKQILEGTLAFPDSWQTELSAGKDKKETFTRLIKEKKLGGLDVLRNLRNMVDSGVDTDLIESAIDRIDTTKILPFRFLAAARTCPAMEAALDRAMQKSIQALPRLRGKTLVLADVSGSMMDKLSGKSDLTRMDAAATLASMINADSLRVVTFSTQFVEVPARRGMAGVDAIIKSQRHGGTELTKAVRYCNEKFDYDRIIVITDEQGRGYDPVDNPKAGTKGYMINVASYKNGVGYGKWTHIDGFSENVLKWMYELETANLM